MNLKEQLTAALQRQQTITEAVRAAGQDNLTADQQREFDEAQREIDSLRQQIAAEEAREAERARIAEITDLCRAFGQDPQGYITGGQSPDEVRQAVLEELKKSHHPSNPQVGGSGEDDFRRDAADALQLRAGRTVEKATASAREMAGMSLRDMAIECLHREGQDQTKLLRMSSSDLFDSLTRAYFNPEAAFPAILDQTIQKNIVTLYNEVPTTFQTWTSAGSVKDFKPTPDHSYVIGGGEFFEVPENGELKASRPTTELLPNRQIKTYGTQFSMSRQAFVDDDIGFLSEVPGLYAAAAKRQINRQCYEILYNNPVIFDGKALFCADHSNLSQTAGTPSMQTLQSMLVRMQLQKNHFGQPINVTPRRLIVPVGFEMELYKLLKSAGLPGTDYNDVNPLQQYGLQVVSDATLNALAGENDCPWFMAADLSSVKGIQVDYLNGIQTPTIRRSEVPGQLGFVWDIWMDWGITVLDYRGFQKNPGEALSFD